MKHWMGEENRSVHSKSARSSDSSVQQSILTIRCRFKGFSAQMPEPDQISDRPTVKPVELIEPIRFLKQWCLVVILFFKVFKKLKIYFRIIGKYFRTRGKMEINNVIEKLSVW